MHQFTRLGGDPAINDDKVIVHCPNNSSWSSYNSWYYGNHSSSNFSDPYYNNTYYNHTALGYNNYSNNISYVHPDHPCNIDMAYNSSFGAVDFWIDHGIPDSLSAYDIGDNFSLYYHPYHFYGLPGEIEPIPEKIIEAEDVSIYCRYKHIELDGDYTNLTLEIDTDTDLDYNEYEFDINESIICIYDQLEFPPTTTSEMDGRQNQNNGSGDSNENDNKAFFAMLRQYHLIDIILVVMIVCVIVLCFWYWIAMRKRRKRKKMEDEIFANKAHQTTDNVVQIDATNSYVA